MTNTFMLAGESDPETIIRSVPKGLTARLSAAGRWISRAATSCSPATESYLIEDGKLTRPVRGATLIGNGPEALKYVSMVGNDLQLDEGIGICGKEGQSVPVGVGIPTLKIDRMTVGGTRLSQRNSGQLLEVAQSAVASPGTRRDRRRMHRQRRRRNSPRRCAWAKWKR